MYLRILIFVFGNYIATATLALLQSSNVIK